MVRGHGGSWPVRLARGCPGTCLLVCLRPTPTSSCCAHPPPGTSCWMLTCLSLAPTKMWRCAHCRVCVMFLQLPAHCGSIECNSPCTASPHKWAHLLLQLHIFARPYLRNSADHTVPAIMWRWLERTRGLNRSKDALALPRVYITSRHIPDDAYPRAYLGEGCKRLGIRVFGYLHLRHVLPSVQQLLHTT